MELKGTAGGGYSDIAVGSQVRRSLGSAGYGQNLVQSNRPGTAVPGQLEPVAEGGQSIEGLGSFPFRLGGIGRPVLEPGRTSRCPVQEFGASIILDQSGKIPTGIPHAQGTVRPVQLQVGSTLSGSLDNAIHSGGICRGLGPGGEAGGRQVIIQEYPDISLVINSGIDVIAVVRMSILILTENTNSAT